jgi:prepilin-type N-terminal cleavage/methylation domain-containing protein
MNKLIKQAFTLIELLVVIAIIGILSGLIVISMNGSINSANDAKRKANIDAIRKALVIYGALNGNVYPVEAGCNIGALGGSNPCSTLISKISDLLPSPPKDPTTGGYYTYVSNGTDYTVSALLSNSNFYTYSPSTGFVNSVAQVFTTVGTTSWTAPTGCNSIEVLVVGGGGGGGTNGLGNDIAGGGGGGGGVVYNSNYSVVPNTTYSVTVGGGGSTAQNTVPSASGNSVFGLTGNFVTANGGGRGAGYSNSAYYLPTVGSSGGGGSYSNNAGAAGTAGQGFAGGSGTSIGNPGAYAAGGGGGAGALGQNQNGAGKGGNGGIGVSYSISGTATYYGGGGGGGAGYQNQAYSLPGLGGLGGGGDGSRSANGIPGVANTGGGGGGAGNSGGSPYSNAYGGAGGSGIVIVHCK